jgi:hypothetical protein
MAKKKNSRKALAVALGIMGIAGLSLASASQLTVTPTSKNIAVGTTTFAASCDDAVSVAYTYNATFTAYTSLVISDIDAKCSGLNLKYTLKSAGSGTPILATAVVVAPTVTSPSTGTVTVALTDSLSTALGTLDVAIY